MAMTKKWIKQTSPKKKEAVIIYRYILDIKILKYLSVEQCGMLLRGIMEHGFSGIIDPEFPDAEPGMKNEALGMEWLSVKDPQFFTHINSNKKQKQVAPEDRDSFGLGDIRVFLKYLNDEQAGLLCKAIMEYGFSGIEPDFQDTKPGGKNAALGMAWENIKDSYLYF